ncbi:MAG: hypothetical protein ABL923_06645 [Burkholderiaceae bacterium]
MSKYQTAIKTIQSIARMQEIDLQEACNSNAILVDLRAVEIINVSPLPDHSDHPVAYASQMKSYDIDGKVVESLTISSFSTYVFSGLVEITDPQAEVGGIEYGVFKIIEMRSAFPDLPIGKHFFAHVAQDEDGHKVQDRHFEHFENLWTYAPATEKTDPERRLTRLRELGGNSKYANGEWTFTGISKLVQSEKENKCKRSDEKTIRADLRNAAQSEHDAKRAGPFDRLGQ